MFAMTHNLKNETSATTSSSMIYSNFHEDDDFELGPPPAVCPSLERQAAMDVTLDQSMPLSSTRMSKATAWFSSMTGETF
ncbi:hypothetical protein Ae201684P_000360 [Aphanomyces euteiches]|uniref:Uncharacterized protein n=1 Tax=Aphanomyces euteiches TaxID=100861 RepID=A0A6G0XR00_9STRA|nr:hypothetical protein Ae201684_002246 [Aphanomyces euteiches]KAH9086945.1 hypothetical protein Ae201684P_000360 [Aphanomyces euteiches]